MHDYLIIGQGLAGTVLAHELISRGQNVHIIDNHHTGSSTKVAAGIINPITGHRLNLTDNFKELYQVAQNYYQALEKTLSTSLWQNIEQVRLIKNMGQSDHYLKRADEHQYDNYLGKRHSSPNNFRNANFGACDIHQTAIVDTNELIVATGQWLKNQGFLSLQKCDYENIHFNKNNVELIGIKTKQIIFCEGYQAIHNPWLNALPFKLSKGELLNISSEKKIKNMLNWGNWLVPKGNIYRLGSNFAWNDLDLRPDISIKNQLLESLQMHTYLSGNVIAHDVGIRPTTINRKPFVGQIQSIPNAYCFNGFGSKGCLTVPYYAKLLSEHLICSKPLPKEITQFL